MATAPNFSNLARFKLREDFALAVFQGRTKPLVLPFSLLGPFILPTIWLAIPHTKRPWLYQTRWLVLAFVVAFDIRIIQTTSSINMACSYAAGLMALWGVISTAHLLIWTRPQFDAARAVKRFEKADIRGRMNGVSKHGNGTLRHDGVRQRKQHVESISAPPSSDDEVQPKLSDCVWEKFPEDAPFSRRLNWAFDLTTNLRCAGWTCSVSVIPRPVIPSNVVSCSPVDLSSMPKVSSSGFERCTTEREFVVKRLCTIGIMYLVLDSLSVIMVKDPFFCLGPEYDEKLPSHLQGLSPTALLMFRELGSLLGILAAIAAMFNLNDLFQFYVLRHVFPIRGELWQYTSHFGGFSQILDRGLAGWWGSWWHQTFRLQFMAPSTYLIKNGYINQHSMSAKVVSICISFAQSGLLHASGSMTSIPETKAWRALAFFLLQVPGIMINEFLITAYIASIPRVPRRFVQLVNLIFSFSWMYLTAPFFVDDLASTGLWLLEPVPISPVRMMGWGYPGDHWWRWDRDHWPRWHTGNNWWETGIAL